MSTKSASRQASRKSGPKALRLALFQNGKIIEERLLRKKQRVTVGHDPKSTFQIPAVEIPRQMILFDLKDGEFSLLFDDKMGGRVSLGEGVNELAALRRGGKAKKEGDFYRVNLNDRARGKVVFGEVMILFQFVTPPPPRPRPQLPSAMRGGLIRNIDWNLALILLISAIVQAGSVWWVQVQDWPEPRDVQALPDRFVKVLSPEDKKTEDTDKKLDIEKVETADKSEKKKEVEKKVVKKQPVPKKVDPDKQAAKEAARKKAIAKKVENKTILKTIGAISPEGGTLADALRSGAEKRSLDEAFKGSTGIERGTAGMARSGLKRSGSAMAKGAGKAADIGDLRGMKGAGDAKVDTGTKRQAVSVKGRVSIKGSSRVVGDGVINKGAVSAVFRSRAGALRSCYERELKKNPKLGGKLIIRFMIGTAGRVTSASVGGSVGSPAVNACVASRVRGWKFPKPEGGSVTVSKAILFSPGS
jgi:TonB family protein